MAAGSGVIAGTAGVFYGQPMLAGRIYTVAGNGEYVANPIGSLPSGVPATSAWLAAGGVAADHAGNLVIADTGNNRVRVVAVANGRFYGRSMVAGDIYTIAGSPLPGLPGNDNGGPASKARFSHPTGIALDHHGNLLISDPGHGQVRVIAVSTGRFYGQNMTTGDIYTIAGNGSAFSVDGGLALTSGLDPRQSAVDSAGNVVVVDNSANRILVVAAGPAASTAGT